MLFVSLSVVLAFVQAVIAASRTSPPSGALVVRAGTSTSGEYKTVQAAVNALPSDSSSRSIFIYPGTYTEQVYITRPGPLTIYGYTDDTSSYSSNQVTIQFNKGRDVAASNDETGTLPSTATVSDSMHADFTVTKTPCTPTRELKSTSKVIFKERPISFTDARDVHTLEETPLPYLVLDTSPPLEDSLTMQEAVDVFNSNTVVQASGAESGTSGGYYFGRPWDVYAKVIFKNTVLNVAPNKALWTLWNGDSNSVSHAFLADYKTSGSGASGLARASFARQLSDSEANSYTISSAVGSDYANWVDMLYFV
uniref:pectinesterase n=1 Tax=Moniliophthora roreri TaxID=221103 RepID=A0A0W0G3W3_MONRR